MDNLSLIDLLYLLVTLIDLLEMLATFIVAKIWRKTDEKNLLFYLDLLDTKE